MLKFTGTKRRHADGSETVSGYCSSGPKAINLAINRANTLPSYFIPSYEFVGPELPLHAAMRRLMTEEIDRRGSCTHQ